MREAVLRYRNGDTSHDLHIHLVDWYEVHDEDINEKLRKTMTQTTFRGITKIWIGTRSSVKSTHAYELTFEKIENEF